MHEEAQLLEENCSFFLRGEVWEGRKVGIGADAEGIFPFLWKLIEFYSSVHLNLLLQPLRYFLISDESDWKRSCNNSFQWRSISNLRKLSFFFCTWHKSHFLQFRGTITAYLCKKSVYSSRFSTHIVKVYWKRIIFVILQWCLSKMKLSIRIHHHYLPPVESNR